MSTAVSLCCSRTPTALGHCPRPARPRSPTAAFSGDAVHTVTSHHPELARPGDLCLPSPSQLAFTSCCSAAAPSQPTHPFGLSPPSLFFPVGSAPTLLAPPAPPQPVASSIPVADGALTGAVANAWAPVGAGIAGLPCSPACPASAAFPITVAALSDLRHVHQASSARPASPLAPDLAFPFPEKTAACGLHPLS